jgi:hypothetical protein
MAICAIAVVGVLLFALQERLRPEFVVHRFAGAMAEQRTGDAYSYLSNQLQKMIGEKSRLRSIFRDFLCGGTETLVADQYIRSLAGTAKLKIIDTTFTSENPCLIVEIYTPTQPMIQAVIQRTESLRDIYFSAYEGASQGDSTGISEDVRTYVYAAALDSLRSDRYLSWLKYYSLRKFRVQLEYGLFGWKIRGYELIDAPRIRPFDEFVE